MARLRHNDRSRPGAPVPTGALGQLLAKTKNPKDWGSVLLENEFSKNQPAESSQALT